MIFMRGISPNNGFSLSICEKRIKEIRKSSMFHCLFIVFKIPLFSMPSIHDPLIGMSHCLFIVLKIALFSMASSQDLVSYADLL